MVELCLAASSDISSNTVVGSAEKVALKRRAAAMAPRARLQR